MASNVASHSCLPAREREQVTQLFADLVDQPLLPDQPAVRDDDLPVLHRARDGREQLIEIEGLRHERKGFELVGGDRRRE